MAEDSPAQVGGSVLSRFSIRHDLVGEPPFARDEAGLLQGSQENLAVSLQYERHDP
jgi:hypothetical protein